MQFTRRISHQILVSTSQNRIALGLICSNHAATSSWLSEQLVGSSTEKRSCEIKSGSNYIKRFLQGNVRAWTALIDWLFPPIDQGAFHHFFSAIPSVLSRVLLKKYEKYVFLGINYWYYVYQNAWTSYSKLQFLSWQTPNFIFFSDISTSDQSLGSDETKWRTSRWSLWRASQFPNAEQLKAIQTKTGVNTWVLKHPECQANMQVRKFQNLILWGECDLVACFVVI